MQRTETPELVPEDTDPIWSSGTEKILSSSMGLKQQISSIIIGICDLLGDPRMGPILLLGALMSFGGIWLWRSQATNLSESKNSRNPNTEVSGWLRKYLSYFCKHYSFSHNVFSFQLFIWMSIFYVISNVHLIIVIGFWIVLFIFCFLKKNHFCHYCLYFIFNRQTRDAWNSTWQNYCLEFLFLYLIEMELHSIDLFLFSHYLL